MMPLLRQRFNFTASPLYGSRAGASKSELGSGTTGNSLSRTLYNLAIYSDAEIASATKRKVHFQLT